MGKIGISSIINVDNTDVVDGGQKLLVNFTVPHDSNVYSIKEDISFLGINNQAPDQTQTNLINSLLIGAEWIFGASTIKLLYETYVFNDNDGHSVIEAEIPSGSTPLGDVIETRQPTIFDTRFAGLKTLFINLFGTNTARNINKSSLKTHGHSHREKPYKTNQDTTILKTLQSNSDLNDHDPHGGVAHNKMHIIKVSKVKRYQGYHKAKGDQNSHMLISPQQVEIMKIIYAAHLSDDGDEFVFGDTNDGNSNETIIAVLHLTDGIEGTEVFEETQPLDYEPTPGVTFVPTRHHYVTSIHSPDY